MLSSIEAERARNGLSKDELAKKLGVSIKTYYNWINEETDMPISKLVTLARLFGTDIDYLIQGMSGVVSDKRA
jgi:transcriptional regulator with XRE-family HTH domain